VTGVIGVDLALRSTGIAVWGGEVGRIRTDLAATRGLTTIQRRCLVAQGVCAWINRELFARHDTVLVVLEGCMAHSPAASKLLPLHGVVVDAIEQTGAALVHVAPQALKRFACGKAGAKAEMIPAAQAAGCPSTQPDECDAWLLALIGHHLLGGTEYASPHRASCLAAVEWEIALPVAR